MTGSATRASEARFRRLTELSSDWYWEQDENGHFTKIFGPVLAVTKARDFEHALELANDSVYGLTGAVFSNSPDHLRQARERFHVGNLYFNRKCTGAMVGAHPFGGFNMSGTDSKAGGPDYLLLFLQAKSVASKVG